MNAIVVTIKAKVAKLAALPSWAQRPLNACQTRA
jgi:hypothetical protein